MRLIDNLNAAMSGDPRDLPRIARIHPPAGTIGEASQKGRASLPGARLVEVPPTAETELAAMHAVLAELAPLSGAARARVIKWVDEVLSAPPHDPDQPTDEVNL